MGPSGGPKVGPTGGLSFSAAIDGTRLRPEVVALARKLSTLRPKAGQRDVSKELAARGFFNELGNPYAAKSVASMSR